MRRSDDHRQRARDSQDPSKRPQERHRSAQAQADLSVLRARDSTRIILKKNLLAEA